MEKGIDTEGRLDVEVQTMSAALDYLLSREWSVGNGQCPECLGVPASWYGHPCYRYPDQVGHKKDCPLAASIKELGGEPLMVGTYKGPKGASYADNTIRGQAANELAAWGEKISRELDDTMFKYLTGEKA
jgi:hypothetical protein